MKGPGFFNGDLSLFKNFRLSEKKKLQFRISANNFLNHPISTLTPDNLTLEFVTDNPKSASPKLVPSTNTQSRFGRVTDNERGRRIVTLAVKFYF